MHSDRFFRFSDPYFSLIVFSIYSSAMGAVLLFAPTIILPLFRVAEAVNAYTYMLGFVLLASAFYYVSSGVARSRHFARLTVYTRLASPVVTVALFAADLVPLNFVLLSVLDGLGGIWTLMTLRQPDAPMVAA